MPNVLAMGGYLGLLTYTFLILKRNRYGLTAKTKFKGKSRWITTAGLLAALAALLHAAPIFFPVLGMALSPLSSIPMIMGVLLFADGALAIFLTAALLLFFINVEEAVIFLLATGPLGLATALATVPNISLWKKAAIPTALLTCGILLLALLVGVPGIQSLVAPLSLLGLLSILIFSLIYALLFMGLAKFTHRRLLSFSHSRGDEVEIVDPNSADPVQK